MPEVREEETPALPGRGVVLAAIAVVVGVLAVVGLVEVGASRPDPRVATPVPRAFDVAPRRRATSRREGESDPSPRTRAAAAPAPSRPVGLPFNGRLEGGVRLRPEGATFFSWDPVVHVTPNRLDRRYGTKALIRGIEGVLANYTVANPGAPRVGIGDLSRPRGGPFGSDFGGLGHGSHQNGLDVDIYYPRRDGQERPPDSPDQIDRRLAQDLVNRWVRAGAQFVFVGPNTGLGGRRRVVQQLVLHDEHMHGRIFPPRR